jgi:hypothetical protein
MVLPVLANPFRVDAQETCGSAIRSSDGVQIDLAPPGLFVDVCIEDKGLCKLLTAGYPQTSITLAYFVLPAEWMAYARNPAKPPHFTRYLIAQRAKSFPPDGLPEFKQYLHSKQGDMPDHTKLPEVFASEGRVNLGITDETTDSISFGVVMKVGVAGEPSAGTVTLASINSIIAAHKKMLSLYTFDSINDPLAIRPVEALSRRGLTCLRTKN